MASKKHMQHVICQKRGVDGRIVNRESKDIPKIEIHGKAPTPIILPATYSDRGR